MYLISFLAELMVPHRKNTFMFRPARSQARARSGPRADGPGCLGPARPGRADAARCHHYYPPRVAPPTRAPDWLNAATSLTRLLVGTPPGPLCKFELDNWFSRRVHFTLSTGQSIFVFYSLYNGQVYDLICSAATMLADDAAAENPVVFALDFFSVVTELLFDHLFPPTLYRIQNFHTGTGTGTGSKSGNTGTGTGSKISKIPEPDPKRIVDLPTDRFQFAISDKNRCLFFAFSFFYISDTNRRPFAFWLRKLDA